jgi:hypothetical protein
VRRRILGFNQRYKLGFGQVAVEREALDCEQEFELICRERLAYCAHDVHKRPGRDHRTAVGEGREGLLQFGVCVRGGPLCRNLYPPMNVTVS